MSKISYILVLNLFIGSRRQKQMHNKSVVETTLDELLLTERIAVVLVERSENDLDSILYRILAFAFLFRDALEIVERLEHFGHLGRVYRVIAVDVEDLECEMQPLGHVAVRQRRERQQELVELDRAVRVDVEHVEDQVAILLRISIRVQLFIGLFERRFRQSSVREVFLYDLKQYNQL
jgi:hypothetical protein